MATLDMKPMANDSSSDDIINTEKYVPINNENPYLVLLDKQEKGYTVYKSNVACFIFLTVFCFISGSLIGPILLIIGLYGLVIEFTILIIVYVFLLYFNDRKMTFIKDESNNKLNIVIANYFCCSKKTTKIK